MNVGIRDNPLCIEKLDWCPVQSVRSLSLVEIISGSSQLKGMPMKISVFVLHTAIFIETNDEIVVLSKMVPLSP